MIKSPFSQREEKDTNHRSLKGSQNQVLQVSWDQTNTSVLEVAGVRALASAEDKEGMKDMSSPERQAGLRPSDGDQSDNQAVDLTKGGIEKSKHRDTVPAQQKVQDTVRAQQKVQIVQTANDEIKVRGLQAGQQLVQMPNGKLQIFAKPAGGAELEISAPSLSSSDASTSKPGSSKQQQDVPKTVANDSETNENVATVTVLDKLNMAEKRERLAEDGMVDDELEPVPSSSQTSVINSKSTMAQIEAESKVTPGVAGPIECIDQIANFIQKANISTDQVIGATASNARKRLFSPDSTPMQTQNIRFAKKRRQSRTQRAGLYFPVTRMVNKLKKGRYARHIGVGAGVYMAAVLEYLTAEVLELAGSFTTFYGRVRITPRSILLTMKHDYELDKLTKNIIVPQGGVRPNIHPALVPKNPAATDPLANSDAQMRGDVSGK